MEATWTHLRTAPAPFGELAWAHARQVLASRGSNPVTEAEIAAAAADLLDRAGDGPGPAGAGAAAPRRRRPHQFTALAAGRRAHRSHRRPAVAPPRRPTDGDQDPAGAAGDRDGQPGRGHAGAGDPAAVVRRAQGGREMVVADPGLLEDRRAPATTLEGWRSFISADPSDLALLPAGQWEALGDRDRRDYDEARIAHHAELVVVSTSAIAEITGAGQMLVLMNQREIGARRGLIVSGDAATGKTTSIKQLGRLHELRVRARFPAGDGRIPVVDVTCPPKGSPRKLAMEFARFLGLPLRTRANVTDIANAVCQVLIDARTDLVLVDPQPRPRHPRRGGPVRSPEVLHRAPARDLYICRDRRRAVRGVHRHPRPPARRPLRADLHRAVPLPPRMGAADRRAGGHVAAAPPRARHAARPGPVSAPAHRRHDRQPDPPGPRRGDPRHLGRPGSDHPAAAGQRAHRPRRRVHSTRRAHSTR